MKATQYAPSFPTPEAWMSHVQSGWGMPVTAGLELVKSPALALAEVEFALALADAFLEEARAAITAARWVMADEDGDWDEVARLLTEADIALTAAETVEIETQLSLLDAERALTDLECGTTDSECSLANRECCMTDSECSSADRECGTTDSECSSADRECGTTDSECSSADRECCTTDSECSLADRACRNTDPACPRTDADSARIDAYHPEELPLWTHPFTLRRTPPWLFGVLT